MRWEEYPKRGYIHFPSGTWALKQWEVKVKNQRKKIRLSHSEYERLCEEMGLKA